MGISIWQIAIILVVVLLLFGAGKIPRLMGDMAKGITAFKKGLKDADQDDEKGDAKAIESGSAEARVKDEEKDRAKG